MKNNIAGFLNGIRLIPNILNYMFRASRSLCTIIILQTQNRQYYYDGRVGNLQD